MLTKKLDKREQRRIMLIGVNLIAFNRKQDPSNLIHLEECTDTFLNLRLIYALVPRGKVRNSFTRHRYGIIRVIHRE